MKDNELEWFQNVSRRNHLLFIIISENLVLARSEAIKDGFKKRGKKLGLSWAKLSAQFKLTPKLI